MSELNSLHAELAKLERELIDVAAERDGKKVAINGSFGKLGSKWSALYAPDLMIQVTITGQLALLMLIEAFEEAGIAVVSANTDGVVFKCPVSRRADIDQIVADWEVATGFETEETRYTALYSRDVNNYIAVKPDGKVKLKGAFAPTGLMKNPANQISIDAAVAYLTKGTPVDLSVRSCNDLTKFLTVRQVQGGGIQGYSEFDSKAKVAEKEACLGRAGWTKQPDKSWVNEDFTIVTERDVAYKLCTEIRDPVYLGKAVRWYYGVGETRDIRYKTNRNAVPRSKGAVPTMDLPDEFPTDIDYLWYIREAFSILKDVGHPRFQWNDQLGDLI